MAGALVVALALGVAGGRVAHAQAPAGPVGPLAQPPGPPPPENLDPRTGVRQRSDRENPRYYQYQQYQQQQQQQQFQNQPRPGTVVEAASSGVASSSRVQVEQRPQVQRPASAPSGAVEQLIQRSQGSIDFFEMVDDIIDEIARQLAREDPNLLSPMSIKLVRLSSNMRPEFARTLESRLIAKLVNSTGVKINICVECTALRSRVENGNWILTLGATSQQDLQRIGQVNGIKTFMELDFTYSPVSQVVWMQAMVFRASDGGVVWTDAYRSDATMAALLRTGKRIPTRAERAAELEQKINARPNYGYAASLGIGQIGYTGNTGDIIGAQVSLRFHEKFGEDQGSLFGLSAGIFTTGIPKEGKTPSALNSILLGAYFSHNLSQPNLNKPEVWLYTEAGGMFSGNEGNTFYAEGGVDTHLKWRLSLQGGVMYVLPTKFSGADLGGVGFRLRTAMNW
jgi:hypothetical protein